MANKIDNLQQAGFTLIELMVGLVIGLIASLVVMQTFSEFEGNKRSTTGTSDAQTSGSIGLYMVQRELQFAGYGIPMMSGTMPAVNLKPYEVIYKDNSALTQAQIDANRVTEEANYLIKVAADKTFVSGGSVYSALKCNFPADLAVDADNNAATAEILKSDIVNPVTVVNGAVSDSIIIRYGDTTRGALATNISKTLGVAPTVLVNNNLGCRPDDTVLIVNPVDPSDTAVCDITKITSTLAELNSAQHDRVKLASLAAIDAGSIEQRLTCLGNVREITFDVNANQLRRTNQTTGVQEPVLNEIVSLQAQYGISASPNSEIVDPSNLGSWVNATGVWVNPPNTGNVCSPIVANRNCIKAVRIAIVARNNLLEKTAVSQACNGNATNSARVCVFGGNMNFANADWPNYRYRVYEVVVPLKNVLAATPQL